MKVYRVALAVAIIGMLLSGCHALSPEGYGPYRSRTLQAGFEERVSVQGTTIDAVDMGEGTPVVLLHRLGGSATDWRRNQPGLAKAGYRTIALDLPGVSYSGASADTSVAGQAHMLRGFLDELALDRVFLVGASYGGLVALCFAELYPERLLGLVLLSPLCYPRETEWAKAFEEELKAGTLDTHFFPRRFSAWSPQCLVDYRSEHVPPHQADELFSEQELPGSCTALRELMWNLLEPAADEVVERLSEIHAPTLIVWGREDKVLHIDYARRLYQTLPNSTLYGYPGCGHFPYRAFPYKANADMVAFFKSIEAPSPVE